jgi:hypothetical protein
MQMQIPFFIEHCLNSIDWLKPQDFILQEIETEGLQN